MDESKKLLLLLMIFSDGETWWDALVVVECKEGMYNKKNKRDTLLKS
jgi:hypothetical protein